MSITGSETYTVEFDNFGYNKGRLAVLEFQGSINYISFSENVIASRNSSFQSFPSALLSYQLEENQNKKLFFYFLASSGSNIETPYFLFMYRLMKTVGTEFLNAKQYLHNEIHPFNSVGDLINSRSANRVKNSGNNSSYITINDESTLQVYGKTYGANKYETTLLCIALSQITNTLIELYQIQEGNLLALPEKALIVIKRLGISVTNSDFTYELAEFEINNSLRSPSYIFNLLDKLGAKKCALCSCEIPQIIEGAHIWPVSSIKKSEEITQTKKLEYATDADNGIWLCSNHHKLFDNHLLLITETGRIKSLTNLKHFEEDYLKVVTINKKIETSVLTKNFLSYLGKRNNLIDQNLYDFMD
ncbi:MAG TPA: HNH endonuclease signature motif containing protein [Methylophilus sp.]|uniref:HNH endonuclease signature motif containing protein n=1 Tax=Methylophilus sp. TaxID=29541 RepID=UPI002B951E63|nr:HNH endonuclease signature motif containing protein [Methylophilus sp.]HSH87599.1 HNH endonuclease signature motif containing protein [Methylophilus sp.]